MFNAPVQPTGVYNIFQKANSAGNGNFVNGNPVSGAAMGASNQALSNNLTQDTVQKNDNQLPQTPSSSEKQAKKPKKSLKQKLPYLALLLLAGSIGVIYGLPAGRRKVRGIIEKHFNGGAKKFQFPFKNPKIETAAKKVKDLVNGFIDILEDKTQKTISTFLQENFFKY